MFLKRHKRANKRNSVIDKVDRIHATSSYDVASASSGRETSVSLREIAPYYSGEVLPKPYQICARDFGCSEESVAVVLIVINKLL